MKVRHVQSREPHGVWEEPDGRKGTLQDGGLLCLPGQKPVEPGSVREGWRGAGDQRPRSACPDIVASTPIALETGTLSAMNLTPEPWGFSCCCFFFFPPFLASPRHMEFPGQGSDLSHKCDLSHSCGNARFLTHGARLGIEHVFLRSQDTALPVAPHQGTPGFGSLLPRAGFGLAPRSP